MRPDAWASGPCSINLVVATNTGAIRLWQSHGFEIIGRLPEAFNHARLGYVDALIMYKLL